MGNEQSNQQTTQHITTQIPAATSICDFDLISEIGRGAFATVYLARRLANNQFYAIKVLKKSYISQSRKYIDQTNAELQIIKSLNNPFIVRFQGAFQNQDNLFLVLEYVSGGELFEFLKQNKSFPEQLVKFYVAQLIYALSELHGRQIIMRDLKLENILVNSDGYLKLTDFGLSKLAKEGESVHGTTFCGTLEYLAPEQIKGSQHGVEVDYWALGVITYELMTGISPFQDQDQKKMMKNILKKEPIFDSRFSPECQDFIKQCLKKKPEERIGAGGQIQMLKFHQFLKNIDWLQLIDRSYKLDFLPTTKKTLHKKKIEDSTIYQESQTTEPSNADMFKDFAVDSHFVQICDFNSEKNATKEPQNNIRRSHEYEDIELDTQEYEQPKENKYVSSHRKNKRKIVRDHTDSFSILPSSQD